MDLGFLLLFGLVWFGFAVKRSARAEIFDGASLRRNVEICFASLPSPPFRFQ